MKLLWISIVMGMLTFSACHQSSGPSYDLKGYQVEGIGGGAEYAVYQDATGRLLQTGHVINGVRNGTWLNYHDTGGQIKTITNYINGQKNGEEITLNDRGQVESIISYRNDELHGITTRFQNSRKLNETSYKNGVMDGPFAVYEDRTGKIQRSGTFKNGKQHGELLFFDGEGNITMRYQYDNGEKVSGGIIQKEASTN